MAGVVVLVAIWMWVLITVEVVIATGAAAPGAAPFMTPYVFAAISLPP
jgi:hypothetical protein